jgi:hypothetical protein
MIARRLHQLAFSAGPTLILALSLTRAALAHIDMVTPLPREQGRGRAPNSNLKEGPCGQLENGRTDKVSVFAPGDTIEVTWRETTNHRSYYRVAFDVDGDDAFPTFAGSGIGAQGIDPSGPCPVDGQVVLAYDMADNAGGSYTLQVRLPDVECERCTLQVVQFMYDTMTPYYFQCADLALRRSGAADAGPLLAGPLLAVDAGSDAAAPAPSAPVSAAAAPGCWSQIAPDGARPSAREPLPNDVPEENAPSAAASASGSASEPGTTAPPARRSRGCELEPGTSSSSTAALLLLIGGSVTLCRARRGRRN